MHLFGIALAFFYKQYKCTYHVFFASIQQINFDIWFSQYHFQPVFYEHHHPVQYIALGIYRVGSGGSTLSVYVFTFS